MIAVGERVEKLYHLLVVLLGYMHVSKNGVLEHLNGVFYRLRRKGPLRYRRCTGWEHWLYTLIPIVYTTLYFHLYFTASLIT
jgi:hypothetical protein